MEFFLWEYTVEVSSRDCDGTRYDKMGFLAVESPDKVVYEQAGLFGPAGPSRVRLTEASTDKVGNATVSEPDNENGYRSYDISWVRVTDPEVRDTFLHEYEQNGPRVNSEIRYLDLYRHRLQELVRVAYPSATALRIRPLDAGWQLLEIIGRNDNSPHALWQGPGVLPFDYETASRVLSDLGELYGPKGVDDSGTVVKL